MPRPSVLERPVAGARAGAFAALLALFHPVPSAATVAAAAAFAIVLTRGLPPLDRLTFLVLMVAFQQAAISLHNDWCDRALDAVAKPWRAIPRGVIGAERVRALAWALAAASVVAAVPLGIDTVGLGSLGTAAGFAYSARLKRTRWSWLPFAVAFPLLPLFGAAALDRWPPLWWSLFVIGLPTVLAIHLADTLPDLESDAGAGVRGLAHQLGACGTRRLSTAAAALAGVMAVALGALYGNVPAGLGGAVGLVATAIAWWWPTTHRVTVTAGAAAAALGWVAGITTGL